MLQSGKITSGKAEQQHHFPNTVKSLTSAQNLTAGSCRLAERSIARIIVSIYIRFFGLILYVKISLLVTASTIQPVKTIV